MISIISEPVEQALPPQNSEKTILLEQVRKARLKALNIFPMLSENTRKNIVSDSEVIKYRPTKNTKSKRLDQWQKKPRKLYEYLKDKYHLKKIMAWHVTSAIDNTFIKKKRSSTKKFQES